MYKHAATQALLSTLCILLLISCSSPTPEAIPSSTETPVSPSATIAITETPIPTETTVPSPTAIPVPALERPQYVMDLQLNYSNKSVLVNQTITYPNWTRETLNSLVLAVEPNLWTGGFSLNSLAVDGTPITNYQLPTSNLH